MENSQVVIVTGGGNGIGKQVALSYADAGYNVVIADVEEASAEQTVNEISAINGQVVFVHADLRKPEDIKNLFDQTIAEFGRIDILINNAGVSRFKSVYELTVEEWDDVINTNLRGTFLCAQEAARYMRTNDHGGSIVNIASTRAFMSEKNSEAYAATKGGIIALTHALALSLGDDQITVNSISPGWIQTDSYDKLTDRDHKQHPSQRVGKPADIARTCLFLTDLENNFITGENIIIDGGMTRKMIYGE